MNLPGPEQLLTWPVGIYIGGVVLGQVALFLVRRVKQKRLKDRRRQVHLDDDVLVDHSLKPESVAH